MVWTRRSWHRLCGSRNDEISQMISLGIFRNGVRPTVSVEGPDTISGERADPFSVKGSDISGEESDAVSGEKADVSRVPSILYCTVQYSAVMMGQYCTARKRHRGFNIKFLHYIS